MEHKEIKPCLELQPFIHSFWELKGEESDSQWERIYPDGCPGLIVNLGDTCTTDNGFVTMEFGKTYVVGSMTSFKDSFINTNTHLVGVCLKPTTFSSFYSYASLNEITDKTIEFDKTLSFNIDKTIKDPEYHFNKFLTDRIRKKDSLLQPVLECIHNSNGKLSIYELAKMNFTTVRQLERNFKTHIGISPKEYSNIVRFQNALSIIKSSHNKRSLLDIAFECGYYDHSHLANEIRRNTGLSPTEL